MPATSNITSFAATIRQAGQAATGGQKAAATKAAAVIKAGAQSSMEAVAPSLRLRNIGKNGSKISLSTKTTETAGGVSVTVRASGAAAAILDLPTKGHLIGAGRSTKRLKGGKEGPSRPGRGTGHPMNTPFGWKTGPFNDPGTHGKLSFEKGAQGAAADAQKAFTDSINQSVRKAIT